ELKAALPKPDSPEHGRVQMDALVAYVEDLSISANVPKTHVQAARIPYFLSAWWQLQERETWPVYYTSMRTAFEQRGLWKPGNVSLGADYFAYRATALDLIHSLGLDVWDIERLCIWLNQRSAALTPLPLPKPKPETKTDPIIPTEGTAHSQVQ